VFFLLDFTFCSTKFLEIHAFGLIITAEALPVRSTGGFRQNLRKNADKRWTTSSGN
jgi:hypothetical protein